MPAKNPDLLPTSAGQHEHDAGEHRGAERGLDQHLAGLTPELGQQPAVADLFQAALALALTARGQAHSGVIPVLQQADGAHIKGEKEGQPGAPRQAAGDEQGAPDDTDGHEGDTHQQALPPPARQEVPRDRRHGRILA